MDKDLRQDIANEYISEYFQAEKNKRSGFWKWLGNANDKIKIGFVTAVAVGAVTVGATAVVPLLAASVLPASLIPVGFTLGYTILGVSFTNAMLTLHSDNLTHKKAAKEIEKDIDNGVLSARYNDVLDRRLIKKLNGEVELCTAQKFQLPGKGAASAAFTSTGNNTISGAANTTTYDEALNAKDKLAKQLMTGFNDVSKPYVNAIGVSTDAQGHFVFVGLKSAPTPEQEKDMPATYDGVRVKYKVICENKPL